MDLFVDGVLGPIVGRHSPPGLLVAFEVQKALLLRLFSEIEKELYDVNAVLDQQRLETQSLVNVDLRPVRRRGKEVTVVAREENPHLTPRWQIAEKSERKGVLLLLLDRGVEREGPHVTRVHPFSEEVHGFAPPGTRHPVYEHEHRHRLRMDER